MISYEELAAHTEPTLRRIFDFAGAAVDDRTIASAVAAVRERRESRFNVGRAGRGAMLQPEVLRELKSLFDFFPEALDDPYVKGVRAQIDAALEGRSVPALADVAIQPAPIAPPPRIEPPPRTVRMAAAVRRYGYQITLIALGVLYWVWPDDLIPDNTLFGRYDDVICLIVLSFLSGRVSKRTPGLRDLPRFVARLFGRWLRFLR